MLNANQTNKLISESIQNGKPFFVGRFGGFELAIINKYLLGQIDLKSDLVSKFQNNAGFFNPTYENIGSFVELMLNSANNLDLVCRYWNSMEDYIIKAYCKNAQLSQLYYLEPWYTEITDPWTLSLENKKVLVIHPFETTIKKQYEKREVLFDDKRILPQFDLITLKAVQTIAGTNDSRFSSWFEALNYMYQEAMKIDFDVAIIGCGAYGFPLASMIKESGKQAIHMGGATQLLFGIKGNRWESETQYSYVRKLFNKHWIYPLDIDKVDNSELIENNCYWEKKDV